MIIDMIWRGVVAVWAPAGHGCGIVGQIARAAPGGLITHRSGGKSRNDSRKSFNEEILFMLQMNSQSYFFRFTKFI
jgi:hypothetical protein